MMLYITWGRFTCKFTVFCEGHYNIGYRTWEGNCPTKNRHKDGQHAYTWANVGKLSKTHVEIILKFAVHYTKLLRKNGQWGGGKRGGILYLNKIYDTGFGVYTPKDQRSRRTSIATTTATTTIANY